MAAKVTDVNEAVKAWEAEQARLAAEAAARAAAEAAQAAKAAQSARGARGSSAAATTSKHHVEKIWTAGGQGEIDACRGSVNVSAIANYLGAAFYAAEHWGCGGSSWGKIGIGSTISVPGHGEYRVAGIHSGLVYGQSSANDIPRGYAGYYQTCVGGSNRNMAVWLLQPA